MWGRKQRIKRLKLSRRRLIVYAGCVESGFNWYGEVGEEYFAYA